MPASSADRPRENGTTPGRGTHCPRVFVPVAILAFALSLLSGCMVGPNYKAPPAEVPDKFIGSAETADPGTTVDLARWWSVFNDPMLDDLVARAIRSNKDLRLAGARVKEARAQRGVVASDLYPTVDASGSYTRTQSSLNSGPTTPRVLNFFEAGFDASWEIDIFGGTRRAVEAADADVAASEENRRDVLVSLVAEVARNYLQIRGDQLRLKIAHKNMVAQLQTLELTQARYEAGLSSELNVAQAKAQLATTESRVPGIESSMRQGIHQLEVLLGVTPGTMTEELLQEAPIPQGPPLVPPGIPSDLLRRRPDIRSAERQLAAATARIGVATADLFPKFSLTGSAGQSAIHFSDIAKSASTTWSFGPSVSWRLFDAGRIRSNIRVQDARQEEALITYEKAVLTALGDVENALIAYSREQDTRTATAAAVQANAKAYDIANELYAGGLVDFLNVLVNQKSLYDSEDSLAVSDQLVATNLVALFKALGGGWTLPAPQPPGAPE